MIPKRNRNVGVTGGVGTPDIIPRGSSMGFNQTPVLAQPNVAANPISPGGVYPTGSIPPFQQVGTGVAANTNLQTGPLAQYKPVIKILALNLANLVTGQFFGLPGNIFWVVDSTNSTDRCFMQLDSQSNDPMPIGPGLALEGTNFQGFYITVSTAIPGATMYIAVISDPSLSEELLSIRA
jgi:hypothetical protein